MTRMRWSVFACVALIVAAASAAGAQPLNSPHIAYVYPAGGQRGTTVRVKVGGRFVDTITAAVVSGPGIHALIAGVDKPLTPKELTELRDKAVELQKTAKTPAERQELVAIRMRIGDSQRRNQSPVFSEIVSLSISIDAGAEPGPRQIRLDTALGLSNALTFVVGTVPEVAEKEDKTSKADAELTITLPAVVNGRLIPGDVDRMQFPLRQPGQYAPGDTDRYRFAARKGQDLVCIVSARELMPYLADAVPGWIQATLTLFDASGHEIAYGADYRYQPDPVLHVKIPADGDYVLEIKDALYRGREDFVYRIAIGEFPYITSIFPLGGPAGSKTPVQVAGWNLKAARVTMDATSAEPGVSSVTATGGELPANHVPFAIDSLPETLEREPNSLPKDAQRLTLPVIVNGRIQEPGDVDIFSFQGKAGQPIVAEVRARRLGSPLDSSLELMGPTGARIAFNDDFEDKASGLLTHHADSLLTATLPSDGVYLLRLADVQRQGGSEFGYRLRIGPPRPDFELRVTPAEINAGAGTTVPITVHAIRRDGFAGDIAIALKDAPGGFALSGGVVPAGADHVRMTLTVAPGATKETSSIAVEGRATVLGRTITHRALPADDMMQAFAYRHLVPADGLRVSVLQRGSMRVAPRVLAQGPVAIPVGGAAHVRVAFPLPRTFEKYEFELSEGPEGVTLGDLLIGPNGADFALRVDPAKAKPGTRGNLIVVISGERVPQANQPNQPAAARRRFPLVTLPAIQYEIAGSSR
jgi:hypothetical protein